jgi:hypothetical protein
LVQRSVGHGADAVRGDLAAVRKPWDSWAALIPVNSFCGNGFISSHGRPLLELIPGLSDTLEREAPGRQPQVVIPMRPGVLGA